MAKMINWNPEPFQAAFAKLGVDRLEAAAKLVAADAKRILQSKIKGLPITRPVPPGRTDAWMERTPGALVATIRVVRLRNDKSRNVRIYAGNFKTWWALQTEYGRGEWKGGAKSFLRPAIAKAPTTARAAIQGDYEAGGLNQAGISTYIGRAE